MISIRKAYKKLGLDRKEINEIIKKLKIKKVYQTADNWEFLEMDDFEKIKDSVLR